MKLAKNPLDLPMRSARSSRPKLRKTRAQERKIAQQEFRETLMRFSFSSSLPSMNFAVHTKCSMVWLFVGLS
ncbi:hypothetical protein AHAS_Ahas14G0115600 [Arachis hypogaea]